MPLLLDWPHNGENRGSAGWFPITVARSQSTEQERERQRASHRAWALRPQEIAPGVYGLEVGKAITRSNVYFVRSGVGWVLIDCGSEQSARAIQEAAAFLFGADTPPVAILLTHNHPDHTGAAAVLARRWGCWVYVHPAELPLITMDVSAYLSTVKQYANPLDTWVIIPLLRVIPRRRRAALHAEATRFRAVTRTFLPGTDVPGLPDWEAIPTPGHTPGHVSFFRPRDRVLITGDAVLTVQLNSVWSFLRWGLGRAPQCLAGPPWYTTWRWRTARTSVAALAQLDPQVLACGHGRPMSGRATAATLRAFASQFR